MDTGVGCGRSNGVLQVACIATVGDGDAALGCRAAVDAVLEDRLLGRTHVANTWIVHATLNCEVAQISSTAVCGAIRLWAGRSIASVYCRKGRHCVGWDQVSELGLLVAGAVDPRDRYAGVHCCAIVDAVVEIYRADREDRSCGVELALRSEESSGDAVQVTGIQLRIGRIAGDG